MATYKITNNPDGTVTRKRVAGGFLRGCMWLLLAALIFGGLANGSVGVKIVCAVFLVITIAGVWARAKQNRAGG